MEKKIPRCFYRVSVKALILDDQKRFLLTKEEDGKWDLPGGGLDFGKKPKECLAREIKEEMGVDVISVEDRPSYFLTSQKENKFWMANIIYLTKTKDLEFTPSGECVEVRFFTKEEALKEDLISNVVEFAAKYDPKNHHKR